MADNKKLIVFDMDGTLLKGDNTIGKVSKKLIKQFIAQGHLVAIASGRPPRVILPYYEELGMNGPVIAYNGALVFMPHNADFPVTKRQFSPAELLTFVRGVGYEKFDILMSESDKRIYLNKYNARLDSFFHEDGMEVVEGVYPEIIGEPTYTMIVGMHGHEHDDRLVRCAFSLPDIGLRFWGGADSRFSELYFLNTSKASGLVQVRKFLKLQPAQVVVVGDADNDVEMITGYANSIAMINGEKQIRERAGCVSEYDNNHDGAAIAVNKLVNLLR